MSSQQVLLHWAYSEIRNGTLFVNSGQLLELQPLEVAPDFSISLKFHRLNHYSVFLQALLDFSYTFMTGGFPKVQLWCCALLLGSPPSSVEGLFRLCRRVSGLPGLHPSVPAHHWLSPIPATRLCVLRTCTLMLMTSVYSSRRPLLISCLNSECLSLGHNPFCGRWLMFLISVRV